MLSPIRSSLALFLTKSIRTSAFSSCVFDLKKGSLRMPNRLLFSVFLNDPKDVRLTNKSKLEQKAKKEQIAYKVNCLLSHTYRVQGLNTKLYRFVH